MGEVGTTLSVGEQIPVFSAPSHLGKDIGVADLIGKPLVLFFYLQDHSPACTAEAAGFRDLMPQFAQLDIQVIGVGSDGLDSHKDFARQNGLPFPLLSDPAGQLNAAFGNVRRQAEENQPAPSIGRTTFLFDPALKLAKVYDNVNPDGHADQVLADARKIFSSEAPRQIACQAPVLLIPNVFPTQVCRRLLEIWQTEGNQDSGFMRQMEGKTVGILDYSHKIRRDHFMAAGPDEETVKQYMTNRVIPEIRKAYNFDVTRREDFRIACYDSARGGYFRPHRDNTTDGTAHRRFALSVLLNDEYEGGFLRFPEYGRHTYRPAAGGAVVFSCSLLHELTDVTAGRRFVMLSFFYGEREAKMREEYNRRTGGIYKA